MLSKKHYIRIAKELRRIRDELTPTTDGSYVWNLTVERLTEYFAEDSPRFNRARFFEACGKLD